MTLVCFAVEEEAKPFRHLAVGRTGLGILLTGMGRRNAEQSIRSALAKSRPDLVLSCGFAGGLDPSLASGTVLFALGDETQALDLKSRLLGSGARGGRFHCTDRVITTVAEKAALWKSTGADAVEMESELICAVCREERARCAVVRVVLDTATEGLALDFNSLLTPTMRLDYVKLAMALLKSPGRIPALLRLQKQGHMAAQRLAEVLWGVLRQGAEGLESEPED